MYTDQVIIQLHGFSAFTKTTGVRYNIKAGMWFICLQVFFTRICGL